jgi:hypothetical protein
VPAIGLTCTCNQLSANSSCHVQEKVGAVRVVLLGLSPLQHLARHPGSVAPISSEVSGRMTTVYACQAMPR